MVVSKASSDCNSFQVLMTKYASQSVHTYLKKNQNIAKPQKTPDETTKLVYNQLALCALDYTVAYGPSRCLNHMHKTLSTLR